MHTAHGGAHHKTEMVHSQTLGKKLVLGGYHIFIVVMRKAALQAVAGFARAAMADVVGQDDEVAVGVEELTGSEEDFCELR